MGLTEKGNDLQDVELTGTNWREALENVSPGLNIQKELNDYAERVMRKHHEDLESYIKLYLELTGATIKDIVLVQGTKWKDGQMYYEAYLRPKTVEEIDQEGLRL